MLARSLIVTGCLAAAAAVQTWGVPAARPRPLVDLEQLPLQVGNWRGQAVPLDPAVLDVLPVDTYTHRYYTDALSRRANLYVGYHDDARPAAHLAPHSPLLCMPSLGWHPIETGRTELRLAPLEAGGVNRSVAVTRLVAGRALERQIVLFWYQVNGQTAPDEYTLKAHLIRNVLHARASSVTLVRVAVRVDRTGEAAKADADRTAQEFAADVFMEIERRLPS